MAGDLYRCQFDRECMPGQECRTDAGFPALVARDGDGWQVTLTPGTAAIAFAWLSAGDGMLHLVSAQTDPMATAATLLSIAPDGTAMVSTHGNFHIPGAVTHLGTCISEDN
ncbi:hypothetical protein [Ruegeria marina]|uniref:Uncharacterized protein n=1 Tax=Ruegeria marina TaxID=639004 RepID=A0A1G6II60_9RHOB|nr:hypothetical protein [Ruegeria marina]SDC06272.1 hypothetical protein SAMN04488239_101133 [Ruegeria marina]